MFYKIPFEAMYRVYEQLLTLYEEYNTLLAPEDISTTGTCVCVLRCFRSFLTYPIFENIFGASKVWSGIDGESTPRPFRCQHCFPRFHSRSVRKPLAHHSRQERRRCACDPAGGQPHPHAAQLRRAARKGDQKLTQTQATPRGCFTAHRRSRIDCNVAK